MGTVSQPTIQQGCTNGSRRFDGDDICGVRVVLVDTEGQVLVNVSWLNQRMALKLKILKASIRYEQVKVTNTINKQKKDHLSKLVFSAEDEFDNVRNMLSKAKMDQCSILISQDKVLEEMASHD